VQHSDMIDMHKCFLLFGLVLALCARPLWGQAGKSESRSTEKAQATAKSDGSTKASSARNADKKQQPTVVFLKDSDGNAVPVPNNAQLQEYLNWLQNRHTDENKKEPLYAVTSLQVTGEVTKAEQADLTVHIKIKLSRGDKWTLVPLAMSEAVLQEAAYQGEGQSAAGMPNDNKRNGEIQWWLKGEGIHELTFRLIVSIRKQIGTRRLLLSLPATAVSKLSLKVPGTITAEAPPNTILNISKDQNNSLIEHIGFNERLDVSWQMISSKQGQKPIIESFVTISIEPNQDAVLVQANQDIRTIQGTISELKIRLPADLNLLDVTGEVYQNHLRIDDQHVAVKLTEATAGPINLRWTFNKPYREKGMDLKIDGFDILKARRQTGQISVKAMNGFRVTKKMESDRFVHRINANQVVSEQHLSSAYRILKQPFAITFDIAKVQPSFSVTPEFILNFNEDVMTLEGLFRLQVYRGQIRELQLDWPDWQKQGWKLEPLDSLSIVEQTDETAFLQDESMTIRLLQQNERRFELPIKAVRKVDLSAETIPFTLPSIISPNTERALILIDSAVNIDAKLHADISSNLRAISSLQRSKLPLPLQSLEAWEYLSDKKKNQLRATITKHDPEYHVENSTQLLVQNQAQLSVTQNMTYTIRYGELTQVRLVMPTNFLNQVQFFDAQQNRLTPGITDLQENNSQVRLILPDMPGNETTITARFMQRIPDAQNIAENGQLEVPIIQAMETRQTPVRVTIEKPDPLDVNVQLLDENWQNLVSLDGESYWEPLNGSQSIPLTLTVNDRRSMRDMELSKSLIILERVDSGALYGRALYRLSELPAEMRIHCPQSVTITRVTMDEQSVASTEDSSADTPQIRYRIDLTEFDRNSEHLLQLQFYSKQAQSLSWYSYENLALPTLDIDQLPEQSMLLISLSNNQHLFQNPYGLTPLFGWERNGFYWQRRSRLSLRDLAEWIRTDQTDLKQASRHDYLFAAYQQPQAVSFRTMSRSGLALVGAGLALLLGVVLLKVSFARNALALLVLVFVVALVGLWDLSVLVVLLQPALFGLTLALIAVLIDYWIKQRTTPPLLTFSSNSEFVSPAPSSLNYENMHYGATASDVTLVKKTAATAAAEPVSSSDVLSES